MDQLKKYIYKFKLKPKIVDETSWGGGEPSPLEYGHASKYVISVVVNEYLLKVGTLFLYQF